ncbi:MAG: hypothetical protein IH827_08415, partial [Myxococcales bacterium]|nr:hypothetical protein [Myxococcales bacterium]
MAAARAATDVKDASISKAQAAGEWLGEKALAAGAAMASAAVAGGEAVAAAATRTHAYLKEKGIIPPSIMTSEEMAATIQADRPLEIMAHGLAYDYPTLNEPATLEAAGYDTNNIGRQLYSDGLQYVWIFPSLDDNGN